MPTEKRIYEIDGANFATLDEFFEEISKKLVPEVKWGRNLDAFNDLLRGGFGTPSEGFILRWNNCGISRERFGYEETARELARRLTHCHPSNRRNVAKQLQAAQNQTGDTVFQWLVDIIRVHCEGGKEAEDGVELQLME